MTELKKEYKDKFLPESPEENGVASEFLCECKKQKGWISENQETSPCPNCGRKYIGRYNEKKLTIDAIQISPKESDNGK